MMITWVVFLMVANFMMIVMSPGVVMSWLVMPVMVDIVVISPSTVMLIMFMLTVVLSMMVVMRIMVAPGKITVVMMRNIPVALIVMLVMMIDVMWFSMNRVVDFMLMEVVWPHIMLVVVVVVELMVGLVVSWVDHMMWLLVVMGGVSHNWVIIMLFMMGVMMVI